LKYLFKELLFIKQKDNFDVFVATGAVEKTWTAQEKSWFETEL
jgi:hypothetical protein